MRTRKMSPTKLAVLAYVQAHQPVRRDALATVLGVAEATASNHLKALVAAGKLQKRRIDRHRWVWEIAKPKPPTIAAKPVAHRLRAHEQVSSVWEYARRCAA